MPATTGGSHRQGGTPAGCGVLGKALLAWGWGSSASGEGAEAPLPLRLGVSLGRREFTRGCGAWKAAQCQRGPWCGGCDEPRALGPGTQAHECSGPSSGQRRGTAATRTPVTETYLGLPPPTFQLVPLGKLSQGLAWAGLTTDNARGEAWEGTEMDWETPCRQARGQAASGPVSAGHEGASLRAPPRGAPQYTGTPSTPCFLEASTRGSILTAGPYTEA